jgi:hypothetical protein
MLWWMIIIAVIAAALAYGFWDHLRQSRRLAGLFAPLAVEFGGSLVKPSLLAFPQLRFEVDSGRAHLGAMANSGAIGPVRGPFTFVELTLAGDTGQDLVAERGKSVQRLAGHLVGRVVPRGRARARIKTGHAEFDEAFWLDGSDHQFASGLFDRGLRQKLLGTRLPGLEIRLRGDRISAHCDGIVERRRDLEALIDIAVDLARRCPIER